MRPSVRVRLLSLAAICATVGCDDGFTPEWKVEGFRVLGVQAQPAELHPGETTTVAPLMVDATRAGKDNIVAWLACDPDAAQPDRSSCSNTETLQNVLQPLSADAELPPGVRRLSVGGAAPVGYTAPAGLFDGLSADDPLRRNGVVAQLLAYAIAEDPSVLSNAEQTQALAQKLQTGTVPTVLTLFRVRVSEEAQVNANPIIGGITADGAPLAPESPWRILPGASTRLELSFPEGTRESYQQAQPDGTVAHLTERLQISYYVTDGELDEPRAFTDAGVEQRFTAPSKGPAHGGQLWAVVRDTRGGQAFLQRSIFFCDPSLSDPVPTSFEVDTSVSPSVVRVRGASMDQALELVIGGRPVQPLSVGPVLLEGPTPVLPSGSHEIIVRGRACRDVPVPGSPVLTP